MGTMFDAHADDLALARSLAHERRALSGEMCQYRSHDRSANWDPLYRQRTEDEFAVAVDVEGTLVLAEIGNEDDQMTEDGIEKIWTAEFYVSHTEVTARGIGRPTTLWPAPLRAACSDSSEGRTWGRGSWARLSLAGLISDNVYYCER